MNLEQKINEKEIITSEDNKTKTIMNVPRVKDEENLIYKKMEEDKKIRQVRELKEYILKQFSNELNEEEKKTKNFIESKKKNVSDALIKIIKEKKFILIGERHLSDCEPIRNEVAASLAGLKKEGLTHIALESESKNQLFIDSLDYSNSKILEALKEGKISNGWEDGNYNVLIEAKRLGLQVVLIDYDDGREDKDRDNAKWQNARDNHMGETINSQIDNNSKMLVFIGSGHVHKKEVEGYADGKTKRLGMLLEEENPDAVASIRFVGRGSQFDGLPFMSKTPSPDKLFPKGGNVVILPDEGPIKGDPRVSAADYIITEI